MWLHHRVIIDDNFKKLKKLGMVVLTCNPSTWKLRQEDHGLEASLGHIIRPYLQKNKQTKKARGKDIECFHCKQMISA
jgi:calcineurin-like phosphoesterase